MPSIDKKQVEKLEQELKTLHLQITTILQYNAYPDDTIHKLAPDKDAERLSTKALKDEFAEARRAVRAKTQQTFAQAFKLLGIPPEDLFVEDFEQEAADDKEMRLLK